jgi:two-component system cell cycle sensor histidine kinase/response regulator CckA
MSEQPPQQMDPLQQAERALRESEERYRRLVESSPDAVLVVDGADKISFVNLAGARLFGAERPQQLVGTPAIDLVHPEDRETVRARMETLRSGKPVPLLEERMLRMDGGVLHVECTAALLQQEGRPAIQIVVRDVTPRVESEKAIGRQAEIIRAMTDSMAEGLYALDRAGRVTFMNAAAQRLLGWPREELLFRDLHQMTHYRHERGVPYPKEECPVLRVMETGTPVYREDDAFIRKDGSFLPVAYTSSPLSVSGEIAGAVVVFSDVSERRALQERLLESQRMDAVGRLATGIAHEFSNALSVISGYGALLVEGLSRRNPLRGKAQEILWASERAAGVTRQLLAFGQIQVVEPRVLDLNAVVEETRQLIRRLIGEDIELSVRLAPDLGRIKADPGQVQQAVVNLVVNAREAMPRGGKLTIETRNIEMDEGYARGFVGVEPGHYALLAVSDTGAGMDEETRARIFEPFFGAKEVGRGTGLTLASTYGIVKKAGGHIWVYSEPSFGTTFKVYWPAAGDAQLPLRVEEKPAPQSMRGSETVLVVEDDDMVRGLVREILTAGGYNVVEARNPEEGLRIAGELKGDIQLMITDVIMPGMSVRDFIDRLAKPQPLMKILFMSGYTDEAIVQHGLIEPGLAFLQKPFTRDSLALKVREVLDRAAIGP